MGVVLDLLHELTNTRKFGLFHNWMWQSRYSEVDVHLVKRWGRTDWLSAHNGSHLSIVIWIWVWLGAFCLSRRRVLWGSRYRQESTYPFWRSAQARYGPQGSGRSAAGSARDKGWVGKMRKWKTMEIKVEEKRSSHAWMRWHAQHLEPSSAMWIMTTRTWLTKRTAHSRVSVHVRCVEGVQKSWWSRCHRCRARFRHADAIPSTDFFPSGFSSSLLHL